MWGVCGDLRGLGGGFGGLSGLRGFSGFSGFRRILGHLMVHHVI